MKRAYYSNEIKEFLLSSTQEIIGTLSINNEFSLEQTQREAWIAEIDILKKVLIPFEGKIYLEYSIPRMGERIDAVLIIDSVLFVIEFKVNENTFTKYGYDQVWDYALDLKNFHESSHEKIIVPVLVATNANVESFTISVTSQNDKLLFPINSNIDLLAKVILNVLEFNEDDKIDYQEWENGRYCPTPTIIEAAKALYNDHSVSEISRNDASGINLSTTTDEVANIIKSSRNSSNKSICFVTGVPGAGKTLIGLNIATSHFDKSNDLYSVFLSGNGPLVSILREALTRDKVKRLKNQSIKVKKGEVMSEVKMFIQNVHNFRDECLLDMQNPPLEHVALFDEAQRAWNLSKTADFMKRRKNNPNFILSEPEFLISCLDRHKDWAVIVCLVGGGQEINTGEAGIVEWIDSLNKSFPDWHIYLSSRLTDSEYGAGKVLENIKHRSNVFYEDSLHLSVSMRSFRAENVSLLIKQILDIDLEDAKKTLESLSTKYPIMLTRNLKKAKEWLKLQARGSERYGIVVSSQAERLKPHCIDVKSPMNPIHWFLDGKEDVRSSYYLEDVATEFHIQGLELDWVCVTWDADFRFSDNGWQHRSFRGSKWNYIRKEVRKSYQKNAYRVLLTRARQGMVIVVPEGDENDPTRKPEYYNPTYNYLKSIGFKIL